MGNKIFIELFRFNHKTDYLPYYRKYELKYTNEDKVIDLLNKINEKENFNYDGVEEYGVKINNLFIDVEQLVSDVRSKTTDTFIIEPVSIYRVMNDFSLNNDDFYSKLNILSDYLSEEQKQSYSSLQLEYYASNTLNFNKEYLGDHVMVAASDIISKNPELKNEILNIIDDKENGIKYHTSSEKRVFKDNSENLAKIRSLLQEVTKLEEGENADEIVTVDKISQEFVDFNIAVYDKNNTSTLEDIVKSSKAKYIDIESKNDDMAFTSLEADKNFTYKIAGKVLLDALDNNADFIVLNCSKCFELFDAKQKEISCVVGRDINLPVVNVSQFNDMLTGEKDPSKLGFDNHKVNVTFL